jgi:hypothetical protein
MPPISDAAGDSDGVQALPLLDLNDILSYQPDPKEEIWPGGILNAGMPTALVGAPGVGKSRLALQAAICTILGRPFLGWETRGEGLKWLFLQTENARRRLKFDLAAMTLGMTSADLAKIREGLKVLNIMAMDFATINMTDGHPDRARILKTLEEWQPDIVEIDPLWDAGVGDPNKDADMTETCKGISSTVRQSNPRRAPFVVHHGRTGSAEASKVFGNDAGSFARNSKALNGWLRSQINVADAGVEWPDTIIVGCGKCSDGPKWEPFAVRLNKVTMTYRRLDSDEFDLEEWEDKMASSSSKRKRPLPSPERVAEVVRAAGGEVKGGIKAPEGLVEQLRKKCNITRQQAEVAVTEAIGQTIEVIDRPGAGHKGGGTSTSPGVLLHRPSALRRGQEGPHRLLPDCGTRQQTGSEEDSEGAEGRRKDRLRRPIPRTRAGSGASHPRHSPPLSCQCRANRIRNYSAFRNRTGTTGQMGQWTQS